MVSMFPLWGEPVRVVVITSDHWQFSKLCVRAPGCLAV